MLFFLTNAGNLCSQCNVNPEKGRQDQEGVVNPGAVERFILWACLWHPGNISFRRRTRDTDSQSAPKRYKNFGVFVLDICECSQVVELLLPVALGFVFSVSLDFKIGSFVFPVPCISPSYSYNLIPKQHLQSCLASEVDTSIELVSVSRDVVGA